MSTLGRMAITPAMAMRRFCPPESSSGERSKSASSTPAKRAASRTRASTSSVESLAFFGPKAMS